jgi:ParB family chromosome partitioning protein
MKKGLGRGLSVLLNENIEADIREAPSKSVHTLHIDSLTPGVYQPRKTFQNDEMDSLIQSIREKGIIQPLVVRPISNDAYEIIAGERRYRAAKVIGLRNIPAVIRECSDQDAFEIALIENLQRDDLNALEEAEAFKRLGDEFNLSPDAIAKRVGKSRSFVANTLRLMQLDPSLQELVRENKLSAGHARALIGYEEAHTLAEEIIKKHLNVREVERRVKNVKNTAKNNVLRLDISDVEEQVISLKKKFDSLFKLDTDFKVKKTGATLQLTFTSFEEIDAFLEKLQNLADV